jgi:signal transduction histidine kinase/CheY-like chemotaxis protein
MNMRILTLEIRLEGDVVLTRQRARQVAALLGFPPLDQTRIATAASEIARNAFQDAGGGTVQFLVEPDPPPSLVIHVRERGPGIENLQALLDGPLAATTGTGIGLLGARRLMDRFEIVAAVGVGASIIMGKSLPKRGTAISPRELSRVSAELARHAPQGMLDELQQQNQELIQTLQELRDRQTELNELHLRELEETNRGVVALYAELDDNAKALKRISDLKSRFLSNMSHEFRSPLNTILSLSGFLLDRSDGELTPEQEKQVIFIRRAADGLSALVNDLLDLAKVEAGKAVVRPKSFEVAALLEVLRGTIAPLLGQSPVALVFEEPAGIGTLRTDETKLGQILRNFLSNAVKYTERGEIRIKVQSGPGDTVIFAVSDTGIGIARENHERVFEEFGQVEGPLQGRIKGTGLGLPLSRKLAELLGGSVSVRSELGVGSTFFVAIPRVLREPAEVADDETARLLNPARLPLLVVEDDPVDLLLYEKIFEGSGFQVLPARTLDAARRVLRRIRPAAVMLDILFEVESGWTFLTEMKSHEATRNIPVLVLTAVEGRERALALGADDFCRKPIAQDWLLDRLATLATRGPVETILIIDDQENDRRRLEDLLAACGPHRIVEAASGEEGIRRARADCPNVIFLDLAMPDMTGLQVLERLKADHTTRDIPVIINTSENLDEAERRRIGAGTAAILDKSPLIGQDALNTIKEALFKAGLNPDSTPSEMPHG